MTAMPPVILVFDIGALAASTPAEWREFSRVGSCCIPQLIYEEMKLLFDRSPDPDLERIAKSFNRFYASSGWKITDINAHHAAFKVPSGQASTRRARLSLAVGRCGYGLAQSYPGNLVAVVTKDRTLQQRLHDIPCVNLCGIPVDALLQWSRTGQRPLQVTHKLQQFRAVHQLATQTTVVNETYRPTSPTRITPRPTTPMQKVVSLPRWLPDLFSLLMAAGGLAVAGYFIWQIVHSPQVQELFPQSNGSQSHLEIPRSSA
ncbi:PIN domain-containing protein [Leptolyngbya ohadii]|uniref:PIN domain-containing protein n=1 Tax=Leptolyngbya ohadii TaxID=1962290 RepID=UPI000B598AD7|nr:PIN domain-containing protein [Leptolyngbya ohadii]